MRGFFEAFARNTVFSNIVLLIFFVGGAFSMAFMIRETFPKVDLDRVQVIVPWPGADPEEIEEGISRKVEQSIEGIEGIKSYHTISAENVSMAIIEAADGQDVSELKDRIRNAVETIATFPAGSEKPITDEVQLRTRVMYLALSGEGMNERELKEWAEDTKFELQSLPELSQVRIVGTRDYEISIEVSEERLREYGLTFDQVSMAVRANNLNAPGGTVQTEGEEIRLRTVGRRYTAEEFANIVVMARPTGEIITLDRVADIRDDFEQEAIESHFNGRPSVSLLISKTSQEDTLTIDQAVRRYVDEQNAKLPQGMSLAIWGEMSGVLKARIALLTRNGLLGLLLVFILLWLFLDFRLSFWASMGMPISIMGAFIVMWFIGATINMISLFGLITVSGIIVDDAIVVGEAIYVARKRGATPLKAAVDGVMEVGMPVLAAVLTTMIAFVPMSFVGGEIGKLVQVLPVVVNACLFISLTECLLLLPAHLNHLPTEKAGTRRRSRIGQIGRTFHSYTNGSLEWTAEHLYVPFVDRVLKFRYAAVATTFMVTLATLGLVQGGFIQFQFFSGVDGDGITANVEFPNGTPIETTRKAVEELEAGIRRIAERTETLSGKPLVANVFSLAGSTIAERDGGSVAGTHFGGLRVELLTSTERGISLETLITEWEQESGRIPGAVSVKFEGDSAGLPGSPIEVWLLGKDTELLLAASDALKQKLSGYDGVYQVQDDFRPGKNEARLRLKPEAHALGLTVADLAQQINAGYYGQEAIRLQRGRDDVRVRVRYPESERSDLPNLEQIRVRSRAGFEVPLISVADIDYGPGFATINRTNGLRRVTVTAEVNTHKANTARLFRDLNAEGYFDKLQQQFPGIRVNIEGEPRRTAESFDTIDVAFPLTVLAIYIIIAAVFRSYLQPLVILFTLPFGALGAIYGHMLLGYDLSMMSVFGMMALAGVVVNDAIVMIECVNVFVAQGEPFYEALRRGGARRFRAIILTTVTTMGGLAPLILEQDFQARVLIPMAISLAAGVGFATILTLVLIPCLLGILNDMRRLARRLRTGVWPTAEEVEPARQRELEDVAEHVGLDYTNGGAA
ncbi:MAG: MMPL family transporter [Candidatus Hydrogenedens sp.]|nr:MMPL family transporter [Candidatus Hydrogenedens sp.]